MHRKRRESLTIRFSKAPEDIAGTVSNPLNFMHRFALDRQCNPLDGFFF